MDMDKIEMIWNYIEKAIEQRKKLMIVGTVRGICYFSHIVDIADFDIVENPLHISIQSLASTIEIDLREKNINIIDNDYIAICNPDDSKTEFVIGAI